MQKVYQRNQQGQVFWDGYLHPECRALPGYEVEADALKELMDKAHSIFPEMPFNLNGKDAREWLNKELGSDVPNGSCVSVRDAFMPLLQNEYTRITED